ncbi:MAG: thioredoxin family protein [Candidatus Thalassarchaeaceae archaeon]|jgi:hypothetical protein|nr:thioredoxin family protein [Candidatus Thalassarchaeaceae archaeon]
MVFDIGQNAPPFHLPNAHPNVGEHEMGLDDVMGENGAIVVFSCLHCPYVVGSVERIEALAARSKEVGLGFVAINSNAGNPNYASDSAERTRDACIKGIGYPFLIDEKQTVAAEWGAERTPEFYLINENKVLIYRGRYDDSPTNPTHATTSEMEDAVNQYLNGELIQKPQTDSIGCSIKWVF